MISVYMDHGHLTEGDIAKLVWKIALPASIGFFFNTMFNVVDAFYGGKLGTDALAAMSASFPIFFLIIAASSGVGSAASSLIGNALGAKDTKKAKEYYLTAIFIGVAVSVVLTIIGLLVSKPLFEELGLQGTSLQYALDYTNMIFYGTIFFVLANILNSYLLAIGDTKTFSKSLIFSFILNVILDPWFMYGGFGVKPMGLAGIAFATILVQLIQCIYIGFKSRKLHLLRGFRELKCSRETVKEIFVQAVPSSVNMMTVAIGSFILTYFIGVYGTDAVAAYGTAVRIEQIILIPSIGLNIAALALAGQSSGARNYERIREIIKATTRIALYLSGVALIVLLFGGKLLMKVFSKDPTVISIGTTYLYFAAFIFLSYILIFVGSSILQAVKRPSKALAISVVRQIIVPVILFTIVTKVFHLEITAIWTLILITNWLGAFVTNKIVERELKVLEAKKETLEQSA